MPRHSSQNTDRATITKLRAKVAQLEASLAEVKLNPPEPDMTGWSLEDRIRTYAPSPDEEKELQAEFLSFIVQFGWNRNLLNREKLAAYLSEPDNDGIASMLNINHAIARQLADDIYKQEERDSFDDYYPDA